MRDATATERKQQFLDFVQQQAKSMRESDAPPKSLDDWQSQRRTLQRRLIGAMGGFPRAACPLNPKVLGSFQRDGYRVERILLETRPGVYLTANAYVPDTKGRHAAVLSVHGHWRLAKQEPVVQSRCIGLAKLGFFVLMVDAFGAGERGIGKPLGEYHGEMVAATLWPTGLTLAGLQVYDNMRAVDYLQSRPEVDPERIGVTGASGGGNQTMYVGALDDRLKCVVPVCSVGTYQAYLGAACCMCEVVPGALTFTEEAGVLGLVAPRALMLVNATRDGFQFSVGEAKKSLAAARSIFALYDRPQNARHAVFESKHDYSKPMREAMYGWMAKHLRDEGDGSPIPEPSLKTEAPETLRCFPGDTRPESYLTLPAFAAQQAQRLLERRAVPTHLEQWKADEVLMRESLPRVLGLRSSKTDTKPQFTKAGDAERIEFTSEPGITIVADRFPAKTPRGTLILVDPQRGVASADEPLGKRLREQWDVVAVDLRATGGGAVKNDKIGAAPDHNSAEWSLWIGRPLVGQWVRDLRGLLDVLERADRLTGPVAVVGLGNGCQAALFAATLDPRVKRLTLAGGLVSYVSSSPYRGERLANMPPGILRDVGDLGHIAALVAPRRLVVAGGVDSRGESITDGRVDDALAYAQAVYKLEKAQDKMQIIKNQLDAIAGSLA